MAVDGFFAKEEKEQSPNVTLGLMILMEIAEGTITIEFKVMLHIVGRISDLTTTTTGS